MNITEKIIQQELDKRGSERYRIEHRQITSAGTVQLGPAEFAVVDSFQAVSGQLAFSVALASDDRAHTYSQANTEPVTDPYSARYIASSGLVSVHTGELRTTKGAEPQTFFITYYLVTCLDI